MRFRVDLGLERVWGLTWKLPWDLFGPCQRFQGFIGLGFTAAEGFKVQGLDFREKGLWSVQGLRFRTGGFRVQGFRFRG